MIYTDQYLEDIKAIWQIILEKDRLKNKRILITGCTGLIGSAMADTLLWANRHSDASVRIFLCGRNRARLVHRFEEYEEGIDYKFIQYDLCDPLDAPNMDYVVHLAGIANTKWYANKPVETLESIISGIKHIVNTSLKSDFCRLLYVSSSEVYGRKQDNSPYKETDYGNIDVLNPRSCYPSGKRVAESLCASYKSEYGLDFVVVRPGHVYGPTVQKNDERASSVFPYEAACGNDIVMKSAGQQLRSHCYVLDVISAMITVMLKGNSGHAYNISNKDSVTSIRQFAEACALAGKVSIKYTEASDADKRGYNMMQNSSLDATELENLGWRGLFDLSTGVKNTIDMLRGQVK